MTWSNRVVWLEGMFLRAQHFQQQDRWLEALVRDRTASLRPHGWGLTEGAINRNLLAAGQFATDTFQTKYPPEILQHVSRSIPLGRTGRSEEMAWLVAYLASPAGDFISGTTITIDGARDNWAGPWPPDSIATESGASVAEQRRAKE